ncbi:MAG: ABC transporter permease [Candidatus Sulfotelmatobacter sp.]
MHTKHHQRCLTAMVINDLRLALRQLHKNPGFALAIILTLALGVGVNTAVFSLVNGFLLRPLPYPEPDRLAVLILHQEGISTKTGQFVQKDNNSQDGETWEMVRDNVPSVQAAIFGGTSGVNLQAGSDSGNGDRPGEVRYVQDMRVSAHYFDVLGIQPFLGRGFTAEEDRPNGPNAVIVSYALWQSVFHADRQVLGKEISLKGEPYTLVGILPPHAQPTGTADVFTPLQPHQSGECGGDNCEIIMRLAPGASWQQVSAQLAHLHKPWFDEISKSKGHAWFYASPLARNLDNGMRKSVIVLMLAVSFILLIACANLAGLTLVRIARRTPEIATRLALGATRWVVLRQLWAENLVLALIGAAVGLALARGILSSLPGFLPDYMLPLGGLAIDARVLAFTLAASVFTSLLFGALPALQTRRVDLRSSMAAGSRGVARGSSLLRQSLIGGQLALTVVLVAGAGLLVRSLIYLETLPPGFDATNVMTAKLSLDDARYRNAPAFDSLLDRTVAAMHQIPGVEDAAVGLSVPYERGLNDGVKAIDGKLAGKDWGSSLAYVTPEYFRAFRIPILAGRDFSESDTPTSLPVAVVNADFAHEFFNDPNPIGRHIETSKRVYTIVGVAANVAKRPGMNGDAPIATESVFYLPATQADQGLVNMAHVWFQPSWIVRTRGPVQGLTSAMQRALAEVDPNLPFSGFHSMNDILAENLAYQRVEVVLLGVLAGLALLLSAVGVYGLVSNLVVQRTREIGIRMALGSSISKAMVDVGSAGVVAAGFGLIAGVALSFVALRVLRSELYGVRDYDPLTLTIVPIILAVIAAAASFLPTLRITRIDPSTTLRTE